MSRASVSPGLRLLIAAVVVLFALGQAGCGSGTLTQPKQYDRMPDFSLMDTNPNSATGGKNVSPRQYVGSVTAWYFGFST